MSNIEQLPVKASTERPAPKRIIRPCEYGLWTAVNDCETQMGTVEAYNRLCDWAESLKAKIDRGDAKSADLIEAQAVQHDFDQARIAQLEAQLERSGRDGERYAYLRRRAVMVDCSNDAASVLTLFVDEGPTGEFLDDWVDGQISANKGERG